MTGETRRDAAAWCITARHEYRDQHGDGEESLSHPDAQGLPLTLAFVQAVLRVGQGLLGASEVVVGNIDSVGEQVEEIGAIGEFLVQLREL